jgi:hypothetical protein
LSHPHVRHLMLSISLILFILASLMDILLS